VLFSQYYSSTVVFPLLGRPFNRSGCPPKSSSDLIPPFLIHENGTPGLSTLFLLISISPLPETPRPLCVFFPLETAFFFFCLNPQRIKLQSFPPRWSVFSLTEEGRYVPTFPLLPTIRDRRPALGEMVTRSKRRLSLPLPSLPSRHRSRTFPLFFCISLAKISLRMLSLHLKGLTVTLVA